MVIYQGEVRLIGIEIINRHRQEFEIEAAEYEILGIDGTRIDHGCPTIDGKKIMTLFTGVEKGMFRIMFKYHIGPEILKAKNF